MFGHPGPGQQRQAAPEGGPGDACRPRAQPGLLGVQGSGPEDGRAGPGATCTPNPQTPSCCPLLSVQPGHSPALALRPAACLSPPDTCAARVSPARGRGRRERPGLCDGPEGAGVPQYKAEGYAGGMEGEGHLPRPQDTLLACVSKKVPVLLSRGVARLLVIDSVAAPFRCESEGPAWAPRARLLQALGATLRQLSAAHRSPVLCINQVGALPAPTPTPGRTRAAALS